MQAWMIVAYIVAAFMGAAPGPQGSMLNAYQTRKGSCDIWRIARHAESSGGRIKHDFKKDKHQQTCIPGKGTPNLETQGGVISETVEGLQINNKT